MRVFFYVINNDPNRFFFGIWSVSHCYLSQFCCTVECKIWSSSLCQEEESHFKSKASGYIWIASEHRPNWESKMFRLIWFFVCYFPNLNHWCFTIFKILTVVFVIKFELCFFKYFEPLVDYVLIRIIRPPLFKFWLQNVCNLQGLNRLHCGSFKLFCISPGFSISRTRFSSSFLISPFSSHSVARTW